MRRAWRIAPPLIDEDVPIGPHGLTGTSKSAFEHHSSSCVMGIFLRTRELKVVRRIRDIHNILWRCGASAGYSEVIPRSLELTLKGEKGIR
jgi:hypothetical protein